MRRSLRIAARRQRTANPSNSSSTYQARLSAQRRRLNIFAMGNNQSDAEDDDYENEGVHWESDFSMDYAIQRARERNQMARETKAVFDFGLVSNNKDPTDFHTQTDDIFFKTAKDCGVRSIGKKENSIPQFLKRRSLGRRRHTNIGECAGFSSTERTYLNNRFFMPNRLEISAFKNGNIHPHTYQISKIFCCKFISNGDQLVTASQEKIIRVFDRVDVANIEIDNHSLRAAHRYAVHKEFVCPEVGWAVVDVAVTPNSRCVCYGTWSNCIYERDITTDQHDQSLWRQYEICDDYHRNCVFSLRYSDDSERILCGCNGSDVRVVDRYSATVTVDLANAHEDDVNAVVFGSTRSTIFFSGGDDGLIKTWDSRMTKSGKPVGVFAGHIDGVTSLDTRGDDRYVVSNSKDQTIKLWDVRRFSSNDAIENSRRIISRHDWDYRVEPPPRNHLKSQGSNTDMDSSIMTFRGEHIVRHTLIRCYFSPPSTGQRFIYTGSARGQCVVYDILTGEHAVSYGKHASAVREAAWNPSRQEIVTAGWDNRIMSFTYQEQDFENDAEFTKATKPNESPNNYYVENYDEDYY